jgi:hypothetical protein
MTAHDPQFALEQRGILRWLGFGPAPHIDASHGDQSPDSSSNVDPRERRRHELLSDVASFLLTHRLEVSAYTLAIAQRPEPISRAHWCAQVELTLG